MTGTMIVTMTTTTTVFPAPSVRSSAPSASTNATTPTTTVKKPYTLHSSISTKLTQLDANDILRACSFTTTSYSPTAATSAISAAASTLIPSTSATATGSSSSSSTTSGSRSGSVSGSSSADNENLAPGQGVPRTASLAAVVGLIGLAWL